MTIVDMSRHLSADCEWPFTTIGKSDAETMLTRLECRLVVSGYAQSLRKEPPQQRRSGTVSAGCESPLTISEGRGPQHGSIWDGHRLVVNRHSQPMGEERCPDRSQRIALVGTHNRWGKRDGPTGSSALRSPVLTTDGGREAIAIVLMGFATR